MTKVYDAYLESKILSLDIHGDRSYELVCDERALEDVTTLGAKIEELIRAHFEELDRLNDGEP